MENMQHERNMDLRGEERFGPITSRLYGLFAREGAFGIYEFACRDILSRKAPFNMLDVGTGPGKLPRMLLKKEDSISIYAVDPSPSMLKIAKRSNRKLRIRFALGYSQKLPFRIKFDMIVSSISFHHWAHKKESLNYLSEFLKAGGEIRIYELLKSGKPWDYFVDKHRMNAEGLRDAARGTRLKVKSIKIKDGFIRAVYVKK